MRSQLLICIIIILVVITLIERSKLYSSSSHKIKGRIDHARANPCVLFFEDFENDDYTTHFTDVSHPENRELVTGDEVFDGKRSLRFTIRKGGHYGGSLIFKFAKAGMHEPEELYARYYLRFGKNWYPGSGGKLPGPSGTYGWAGWGGRPVDGTNGWSARMGFRASRAHPGKTVVSYYTYHMDTKSQYGSTFHWDIENRGVLQNESWYCIETYVKMNTPLKNNGILRGWIDGHLAMEKTDLRFRDISDLKVECFWMNLYYGGTWTAPHDMAVYFDNVVLSDRWIGLVK